MTNRILVGLFLFTLTLTFTAPAGAQTLSADEKELASYTLTMPTVRKVANAMQALTRLAAQDPKAQEFAKLQKEIEALENKDELTEADSEKLATLHARAEALEEEIDRSSPGNASTIAEMEQQIRKHPGATAALAKEGLAPREFAKATLALFQAAMVVGFSQGKVDMAKLPPGVNPANVTFFQENQKELEEIQRTMQGGSKK